MRWRPVRFRPPTRCNGAGRTGERMSVGATHQPITIPAELLPADGRFGCGPSKVRPEALAALADTGRGFLGTSHRQAGVRSVVARIREGLGAAVRAPDRC